MIVLETDHVSVLKYRDSARCARLVAKLALVPDEPVAVAVITIEEQMRGWIASIAKERQARRQITAYRELAGLFDFFAEYDILPFDERAADIFDGFGRIRIGTMDRKIAAIALANNALLLTANKRDFGQIPGLRFENWMDEPTA